MEAEGVIEPFPIQELALPLALGRTDIIGQARTGTGKTLAFGIPLLEQVQAAPGRANRPRTLVVVPTRELAIQVAADLTTASKRMDARILTVYGGRSYEPQISGLAAGVDVVVGTPGRLLDLENQGHLDLSEVSALVLDEADKMLDLGFLPDVEKILTLAPDQRQVMLFSATMPSEIVALSRRYLSQPTHVRAGEEDSGPRPEGTTEQHVFRTHPIDKIEMLVRLLQAEDHEQSMVFCETKRTCDKVATVLSDRGFAAAAVHGDLGQGQRERALRAFRNGKIEVLVATDVAARGLDVDEVTHVVNYECPADEKTYVHRIGRTGRAGRTGTSVTFIDWAELARWKVINNALGLDFGEPPETYSTSEHFHTQLRIPADATGQRGKQRKRAGLNAEELEDVGETGQRATTKPAKGGTSGSSSKTSGSRKSQAKDTGNDAEGGRPRRRRRRRSPSSTAATAADTASESTPPQNKGGEDGGTTQRSRRRRRRTRSGVDVRSDGEG
ncbi:DEAD/DEAH box helicase [Lipingzhangella sp. LS1_29]|uniref:RNA helicase n=1 Tax=Lipingzhangella rawalii TaxID=2055835 RepID=A0ABU2H375_9ACTN|nr:DEAD/DEAH box helicase [Lipingzhangella rawalii]MDS1269753.1 DEAD/DEAH box helicase [Lipingzhangella rawalii]